MLDELTQYYGFNRVIQISQLIEDFVFSIAQYNGFRSWYSHEKSNVEVARILIRIANLYYNCSAIIASQLCPDENCLYEPTYYTKLVLILFSLFAMMEDLVRNDETIGSSLTSYTISTELKNISLKLVIPQLALPERKWFDLLNKIEEYFELFKTDVEQIPLKGRLFKNGHPFVCLPSRIVNHLHYKECSGTQNFLVEVAERSAFGQILHCYQTKTKESVNIRVSFLANNNIWIEANNETFVSRSYLNGLPKFFLEDSSHLENETKFFYSHWYVNDKILIKNENKTVKLVIDLNNNEIYSNDHDKFLIPFTKDAFDPSNVLYTIFSRFEDENYILALKNNQQDSEAVIIYLPRLNLKFSIQGQKIKSEDFKDYRLSPNQHINTLFGLPQYLVIELDIETNNPIKFNRKIIIPYHPIENKKAFFSNAIQFNLDKVGKPAYFSYEIDENVKSLNSETTAGSLYLALLYFKTATLDKDAFLEMNGYEVCAEILKTCWQNCQYSDIEFNIILKFFESTCPDLEKPWSNYAGKEEEMFKSATHGLNPHHRNTYAIFLRLIYLLLSSYQTDFLIKPDGISFQLLLDFQGSY
ncbi:unnamed protein product [Rotaria sp. Silwood2]|nr:unnamed protein product [Rotaria sp. Silwood2]CAF3333606.1 unnamed protein product [Rotaria sp. Silwood2]